MSKTKHPKIDIYTSSANGTKNLFVPAGTDVKVLQLPEDVDTDLATLSPFKTRVEVDPAKMHASFDQGDVMRQIENNGFAIQTALIQIVVGSAAK